MSLSISCSLNKEVFQSGEIVSAYISAAYGDNITPAMLDMAVDIQLVGLLKIDYKWTRTNAAAVAAAVVRPVTSSYSVIDAKIACGATTLYCSSIVSVPFRSLLTDGGLVFQAQLPHICMPSFKGISCNIAYNVILDFSKLGSENSKDVAFPVSVISVYNHPSLHKFNQSLSFTIPLSDLCLDKYLFSSFEEEAPTVSNSSSFQSIAISHTHPICILNINHLSNGSIKCYPGASISSLLNFEAMVGEKSHRCLVVKVSFISIEKRPDESIVQEKILFSSTRSSHKAALLSIDIPISDSCTPTFNSFIVSSNCRLDFEFQVESDGSSSNSSPGDVEAAVLSLVVEVAPRHSVFQINPSPHREARRSIEASAAVWTSNILLGSQ